MFYVYALIHPKTNKPFYIGKGSGNRVLTHEKFTSNCNNTHKDRVIKKILKKYGSVPFKILEDNILVEDDAYAIEEKIIADIGIENLTNICESRRPPLQRGLERSAKTKEKIKINSKQQGTQRTIEYIKTNDTLINDILISINNGMRRKVVVSNLNITIDLFNKIKRKYSFYVEMLNTHTKFKINKISPQKINGMKLKVFSDQRDVLSKMYSMIKIKVPRREIVKQLAISPAFYDRFKNKEKEFEQFLDSLK